MLVWARIPEFLAPLVRFGGALFSNKNKMSNPREYGIYYESKITLVPTSVMTWEKDKGLAWLYV